MIARAMRVPTRDVRRTLCCALAAAACVTLAPAHPASAERRHFAARRCAEPFEDAIAFVPLQGYPFQALPSADGCWIYVSLLSENLDYSPDGIAVLRRERDRVSLVRLVPTDLQPTGMVLTHDGALLVEANGDSVLFLDTARMQSGEGDAVLGKISDGTGAGSVYVNCTRDDGWLFVSDEYAQSITVIDLVRARRGGFRPDAIVGKIPVGRAPIALTFSPDERFLYTTSQLAGKDWGWSAVCFPEGVTPPPPAPTNPAGAVIVIDVERAKWDPSNAVVARAPAACNPVRLALSREGDVAFVTARGSNALLAFATDRLVADSTQAPFASVPVGTAPVGVAVGRARGREVVVVANSNRFFSTGAETLSVIDADRVAAGARAVIGHIPAGEFPRELHVLDDRRELVVTNFLSETIEFVDLERLSLGRGRRWSGPQGAASAGAPAEGTDLNDDGGAALEPGPAADAARVLPNPFRDRVELGFSLPTAGLVRVEVFDVDGRCVRAESAVYLPAGSERVTWDGRDNDGRRAPSGSYLIRVAGRGFELHRRVVLLD